MYSMFGSTDDISSPWSDGPAFTGKETLTQHAGELDDYVEFWFKRKVLEILDNHDNSNVEEPFMIMYSSR